MRRVASGRASREYLAAAAAAAAAAILCCPRVCVPNPSLPSLIGHSSGAHISLQSRLRSPTPFVTHLACLSGVYDLAAHSEYEKARGLDELSTLKGAGGYTREKMEECR